MNAPQLNLYFDEKIQAFAGLDENDQIRICAANGKIVFVTETGSVTDMGELIPFPCLVDLTEQSKQRFLTQLGIEYIKWSSGFHDRTLNENS